MESKVNRREFLQQSSGGLAAGSLLGLAVSGSTMGKTISSASASGALKKAACIGVLPRDWSVMDRFKLAAKLGFEGIEPNTLNTPEEVEEYRAASQETGVKIHSIMNSDHWRYPLTDDDPEVVAKCVEGIKTSMHNARELGADAVLLVPGIVTPQVRYADVYSRSQEQVRKLLPLAKELNVIIAIENVGNRFLLSPLEFVRYIDEFESPFVQGYFDVGNITSIGFPQDWIRTIGKRLLKVHIKKFEPGRDHPAFEADNRRTEGINWPDVRKALDEVGYSGWVSVEVRSGDEAYLQELSQRMDRILAGEMPA
ncbi:MAG: sugar phosphate isomerase/epimerase [Acidobacteriota bacterium]|nr:MAG: sugar phosphate isomerase/epimerase [Acidobacteriota bacterium]